MRKGYVTAGEVAALLDGVVLGNAETKIYGIKLYRECTDGYITFVDENVSGDDWNAVCAGAVIIRPTAAPRLGKTLIISPYAMAEKLYAVVKLMIDNGLYDRKQNGNISKSAHIDPQSTIGSNCIIGDNTVVEAGARIGDDVVIGSGCIIKYNSVIMHNCIIGSNTVIDSCAVIGKESIEFSCDCGVYHRVPSVGSVIIGDNVQIDANTVIERGTIGDTVIGSGTKIDSLVRIGHEVKVGENCVIISMTAVAGWAEIGSNCVIYGQCGVSNRVKVGDNCVLMARSLVTKPLPDGSVVSGFPAQDHCKELRFQAKLRK